MVTTKNTQSRLREALKQEDSALADRLPAPARASASRSAGRKAPAAAAKPIATTRAAPKAAPGVAAKAAAQPAAVAEPAVPDDKTPPAKAVRAEGGKRAKAERERHDRDRHDRDRHEKVARDSFSMPASEHKRIKALRDALAQAGCEASKSEVLRAGVALLASRGLGEIINLVGELPKVPKGKRGKKR